MDRMGDKSGREWMMCRFRRKPRKSERDDVTGSDFLMCRIQAEGGGYARMGKSVVGSARTGDED